MSEKIALENVVGGLRKELWAAIRSAQDENLSFQVGQIDVELSVGVTNEVGTQGGIRFWVLELGASGSHQMAETQRIKFALTPMYRTNPDKAVLTAAPWPPTREAH
jgi:hypothetical protein